MRTQELAKPEPEPQPRGGCEPAWPGHRGACAGAWGYFHLAGAGRAWGGGATCRLCGEPVGPGPGLQAGAALWQHLRGAHGRELDESGDPRPPPAAAEGDWAHLLDQMGALAARGSRRERELRLREAAVQQGRRELQDARRELQLREAAVQQGERELQLREAAVQQGERELQARRRELQDARRELQLREAAVQQGERELQLREAAVQQGERELQLREAAVQQGERELQALQQARGLREAAVQQAELGLRGAPGWASPPAAPKADPDADGDGSVVSRALP